MVFGRLRERHPERSIYNALCDDEWNTPIGEALGSGGNALFRVEALRRVNFYNSRIIAGEDSELSMRLRKRGWRLRSIPTEMALHDAAIVRFGQWWMRTRRSGHCYGEMAYLHPDVREPNWLRSVHSIIVSGGIMPSMFVFTLLLPLFMNRIWWVAVLLVLLPWPLRVWQLARRQRRRGLMPRIPRASGALLMLGKLPQFLGLIGYYRDRLIGRASSIISIRGPRSRE